MSLCGATEKLLELTQSIGTTDELVDKLLDKIPITPAQGQSVIDALAIVNMAGDAAAIQALITSKLKEYVPEIEIPEEIKGLQTEVRAFVTKVISAADSAENIANDIETMKTKYSGLDLGDVDIQNIPKLLKDGALDLNNLCQKIANWEETETGAFVLKGTPISTPIKSPVADILGIQIPDIKGFKFRIDPQKSKEQGIQSFINVDAVTDSIGL
tara:strand:- start:15096 stop:15737 length:642 start_codon:yes stop_codon:yes gene_type:complete